MIKSVFGLFYRDKNSMLFGGAKKVLTELVRDKDT